MTSPDPRQNHLLAALAESEWARWLPILELVDMPLSKVLYEAGCEQSHAYFPTTCIISLVHEMENGACVSTAMVGYEGVVGVSLFMSGTSTTSKAIVQSSGQAYRLKSSVILQEFNRAGPVMDLLLRYTQALITQISQTSACHSHHSIKQQLCRFLLLSLDRMASNELVITQELIAHLLGVRREGVTEAAGHLQRAGLIHYHRGHINILNRLELEKLSCECYEVVKKEYDRLLPEDDQCVGVWPSIENTETIP